MEETTYWNHFQSVRFCVQLPHNYKTHLMIPKKFTENVKKRLPDKVFLKGPNADICHSWEVELNTCNNTTSIIGDGWKDFVTAYNLKENDTLVFKYKNNACFKVLMFEAQSCGVEKESSYFIKKSIVPTSDDHNDSRQEKVVNLRKEMPSHDPDVLMKRIDEIDQNPRRVDTREPVFEYIPREVDEDLELDEEVGILTPKRKIDDPEWTPAKISRGELRDDRDTTYVENVLEEIVGKPSRETSLAWPRSAMKARQGTPKHGTPSKNREPTNKEKERAPILALQELTEESFVAIMSPSHVSKTFRLALPKAWTDKYMSPSHQDVILRLNGMENKDWRVRYNFDKNRLLGQFIGGWVHFARANGLREFDACVFTLAGREGGNVCLDVKIIRVIDEEVDEALSSDDNRSGQDPRERHDVLVVGLKSI